MATAATTYSLEGQILKPALAVRPVPAGLEMIQMVVM
jgi:hypothetical protein